jgi:hypothetical protein
MKADKFNSIGRVDSLGSMKISNMRAFKAFLLENKNKSLIINVTLTEANSSQALLSYYQLSIVQDFQQAFKEQGKTMCLESTELEMRKLSEVLKVEIPKAETGGYELYRYMNIIEAGNKKACEYIEDLRVIAATEFGIEIKDPRK